MPDKRDHSSLLALAIGLVILAIYGAARLMTITEISTRAIAHERERVDQLAAVRDATDSAIRTDITTLYRRQDTNISRILDLEKAIKSDESQQFAARNSVGYWIVAALIGIPGIIFGLIQLVITHK